MVNINELRKNRRNFIDGWTEKELQVINSEMNLAQKFGYTEQEFGEIKALADKQLKNALEGIYEYPDIVFLDNDEVGETVISLWFTTGEKGRPYFLTDEGALNFYGEDFMKTWCKLAHDFLRR
ncbi:MAG: hypothetical protein IJP69_01725 [Synergistaceae bacterium]|nr:hypothetical protein [Synergistaceae bacterium]MBR0079072.1 hypothetical protein [Synergistaceae bacterium]